MNNLSINICHIKTINGKIPKCSIFRLTEAEITDCGNKIMVTKSPNFIFFDKNFILDKMKTMRIIYLNEECPDISELISIGTDCFTIGEMIGIHSSRECKISIFRYDIKKYVFLIVVDEKINIKEENKECYSIYTKNKTYNNDYYYRNNSYYILKDSKKRNFDNSSYHSRKNLKY